ncbi:MAG TPA: endonuclease/exonuclease/phosphatase family protein [Chitinophagales bacterium]|nr:endonuclease/exonuclease/phosphatase family protein [Chitinophagales bacterium]
MKFLYGLLSFFSRSANIIAFLLLVISGFASRINPDYFWPFGLFGLAFPAIVILNIFFVLSWILRKRWFFILSLIGLAFTYPQLRAQVALPFLQKPSITSSDLRVMSFNVRNFDLYNWTKNNKARKSMMDSIQNANPDVLLIQEFYSDKKNFNNIKTLDSLGYKHHVKAVELIKNKTRMWGVAIFSKYPIENSEEIVRQSNPGPYGQFYNRGVYADIEINHQMIRFISVHLQSIYFGSEDYITIEELKEEKKSKISKIIPLVKKIGKAYKQRGIQIAELKSFIESSNYPVILGGDFNDTPSSFAYQQMNEILDDTFIQRGSGIGSTYNGIIPLLRIDYIFIDKKFSCSDYKKNKNPHSDHFPIIADIVLSN